MDHTGLFVLASAVNDLAKAIREGNRERSVIASDKMAEDRDNFLALSAAVDNVAAAIDRLPTP